MTTFALSEEKKDKKFSRSRVYTSVLKGWKLALTGFLDFTDMFHI